MEGGREVQIAARGGQRNGMRKKANAGEALTHGGGAGASHK
uniref:Uncharacterized protein n=1 Tax=Arundo donax TaxID=35708 RepID=A0A0A9B634_ARUDO